MSNYSDLLYEILIDGEQKGLIKKTAEYAGVAYRTIHHYMHDKKVNTPVNIIKAAWLVNKDPRLEMILTPEGYRLIEKKENIKSVKDPISEATDVVIEASDLIKEIRLAVKDGQYSKSERRSLSKRLLSLERQVFETRDSLNKEFQNYQNVRSISMRT
ncbi:MAG: hypothetical protein GY874_08810 [Desulfobacteraceae bacterium]|nr:hypothetical protein [Desulfobacteraceae bacterium]